MNSEYSTNVARVQALQSRRAVPSSTNLALVDESTAGEAVRDLFAKYRARFARTELPGIVLCFATDPGLLKGMLEIAENFLFGESLLDRRCKEMIATYVSQQNECPYCADSHGAALAAEDGKQELACGLREGNLNSQPLTSAEVALLNFAAKVNLDSSAITRSDVETAMTAGWTEAQVAETVHIAALFAAFNRIAGGFGLPSPFPGGLREML